MKIAVFYPENTTSAWSCSIGVVRELLRWPGVEVLNAPLLRSEHEIGYFPPIEELEKCQQILLLGSEHYSKMLDGKYSLARWKKLPAVKFAWYHESAFRDDGSQITAEHLAWADYHHFPAVQDAEFFDQEQFARGRTFWTPFGVDTHVFHPRATTKEHGLAFIGMLYPKRMAFLNQVARHFSDGQTLQVGNVNVQDLGGPRFDEQAALYARNLCQIKVFMNLPSLSRLLVTKVYEVMACGTCLLTPTLAESAHANLKQFKNNEHLVYYSERNPEGLAAMSRALLVDDARRETIARQGAAEIAAKHSLEMRLKQIFGRTKETVGVEPAAEEIHA